MSAPIDPPEPVEAPQAGPWADDIRAALGEEHAAAFDAVDGYFRESVQPRMTQLETDTAPARELWKDLNEDPATTLRDLAASVYGDEFATQYEALFAEPEPEPVVEPAAPPEPVVEPAASTASPEDQEALEWARQRRAAEQEEARSNEYQEFKTGLIAEFPDAALQESDLSLIDPFIYSSPEDPAQAVAAYVAWRTSALAAHGVTPAPAPEVPTPPAVLGSEAATASTPPVAPQYTKFNQLDSALDDFMSENRASATPPPIVG